MSRVRTPTVIQMEAVECGAASLAIMLEYFGKWVPLDELRVTCNVSRDGCNAADVVRAAREHDLTAKGFRLSLEKVAEMKAPFIVFWEFRHFLVVEGFGKNCVYINDPETGPRTISLEAFSDGFTGLALSFEPTKDFKRTGRRTSAWADMKMRLVQVKSGLVMLGLVSLLLIVPGLTVPTFSKIFIDTVLIQGATDVLRPLLFSMIVAVIAYAVMVWLQEWSLMQIENKMSLTGAAFFQSRLMKLPVRFFAQRSPGDLVARMLSNDSIAQMLGTQLCRNFANFLTVVFFAIVMFGYDPLLTVIGIAVNLFVAIGCFQAQRALRNTSLKLEIENALLMGVGVFSTRAIDTIKAGASEDQVFSRWSGTHARMVNTEQQLGRIMNVIGILPSVATSLTTAIVLGVGSFHIVNGQLTVGGLVAFLALMTAFSRPFEGLVQFVSQFQSVGASLTRVNDILQHDVAEEFVTPAKASDSDAAKLTGRIELRDVSFGYTTSGPLLVEDLNMVIQPGMRVALVGSTGSGKSTIGQMVAGLYHPTKGEILYDGMTRDEIPPALRDSSIGWVAQEPNLFEGTVYDNLTLWNDTISMETVIQAAKDAEIHDLIIRRPGGYQSQLSEGGRDLSGGEAQRFEIARTLALEPSILILDEATSALDAQVEEKIDQNIRRRGCTCLIIAHRLSTIRDSEEILVLDQGKVTERGSFQSLMSAGGAFHDLVKY
ncbi:MAG: NHLP family bacteriocin export ABC transporter peptidase/permease/ATPase subunit [Paracoccaceae bacterium]